LSTNEDGWAWSVPISSTTRHVGVMVGQGQNYQAEIGKTAQLRRSRDFARAACAEHPSAFWSARAETEVDASDTDEADITAGDVRFVASSEFDLTLAADVHFEPRPVIRGREIVLEDAFAGGLRFVGDVDLVRLAEMACHHRRLPDLFDAYCRSCAPAPLPNVASGLSMLVAKGILHERA
jgi:hypothetical protein